MPNRPEKFRSTPTGRYSPLRYPGGKGKLAKFLKTIIQTNGLSDGRYVEPYAGGAAIAWELLLTGIVREVCINDVSKPVFAFWKSVVDDTDRLCKLVHDTPLSVDQWDRQKLVYTGCDLRSRLQLGFSFFYLNRTNRSGILNGGIIGGRDQTSEWKIDARFNKKDLIKRIENIANLGSKIKVTRLDAIDFLSAHAPTWNSKTLVYLDPPYYEKGRFLYHDAYNPNDHAAVAKAVAQIKQAKWIVSYDDVRPIHELYEPHSWLQYTLNYSARNRVRGREAMFFSSDLKVPEVPDPLIEIDRRDIKIDAKVVRAENRNFMSQVS